MSLSPDSLLDSKRTSRPASRKKPLKPVTITPLPPLSEEVSVRLRIFMDSLPSQSSSEQTGIERRTAYFEAPHVRMAKMKERDMERELNGHARPHKDSAIRMVEKQPAHESEPGTENKSQQKSRIIKKLINQTKGREENYYQVSYGGDGDTVESITGPVSSPSDDDFISGISSSGLSGTNSILLSNVAQALSSQPDRATPAPHSLRHVSAKRLPSMSFPRWKEVPDSARRSINSIRSPDYLVASKRGYSRRLDHLVEEKENEESRRQQEASEKGDGPSNDAEYLIKERVIHVAEQVSRFLGASLPDKALRGWRAEQLSSLLDLKEEAGPSNVETTRTRLEDACGLWLDVCGPDFARRFIEKEPTLLLREPKELLLALEGISQIFGLTPSQCVVFALKNTTLISTSQEKIRSTIHEVMSVMEISESEARQLVMKHTDLINCQHGSRGESLKKRADVLELLLPVTRAKLIRILKQRPMLLTHSVIKHARMISDISRILNLPLFNAAIVAAAEPNLLCISSGKFEARWGRLVELTKPHAGWREQLASYSPFQLARCLCASDTALERLATVSRLGLVRLRQAGDIKRILCMPEGRFFELFPGAAQSPSYRTVESAVHVEGYAVCPETESGLLSVH